MDATDGAIHLIHLGGTPGNSDNSVSVRVLGRSQPGILTGHDFLDCEIVIVTEFADACFAETLLPEDLTDWEDALATLETGRSAVWLDSGRTTSMTFEVDETGRFRVSVHDGPSSGVTVTVPLPALPPTWAGEQRDLLARVREAYPREVVETSLGVYEWRRDGDA
ncbi:DUF5959 family protein [Streptomyces sp. NPDC026673]|uniref:DUF5959 family protein n=1 Tax=Streptomyces sp. NPDC026673 TaxID=3155724 RepID=UPI0033E67386